MKPGEPEQQEGGSLPPCPLKEIRAFLKQKDWKKSAQSGKKGKLVFEHDDKDDLVILPMGTDPIPFPVMIMVIEQQMRMPLYEMPFYKGYIDLYFPEVGP